MNCITTKNAAREMCMGYKANINPLLSTDFSTTEMEAFKKSIKKVALIVNSSYLVLNDADYAEHMRDPDAVRPVATDPGIAPDFTGLTTTAEIEQAKANFAAAKEAFCQQEGVTEALQTLILDSVPEPLLQHLDDNGYSHITPLEMMDAIAAAATEDEAFGVDEQLSAYFELPDLDGDTPLSTYFAEKEKSKNKFSTIVPNPVENHNALQVKVLAIIKLNEDFKDSVREWEARDPADRTWDNFKTYFSEKDKARRTANKKGRGATTAGNSQFGANLVTTADLESTINAKLGAGLAQITERVEEVLVAAATAPAPSADKKKIEELENQLAKLRSERSNRRNRQVKMTTKCPHCKRFHQFIPVERCWANPNYSGPPPPAGWKPAAEE